MRRTPEELAIAIKAHQARDKPISMRQLRLKLLELNLLSTVSESMSTATDAVKIEWEFGTSIERDNPLVLTVVNDLGISSDEADDWFIEARQI